MGVQRLADNVEIFTQPEDCEEGFYVAFSWKDFLKVDKLSGVPITYKKKKGDKSLKGTKIVLTNLRNTEAWRGERNIRELQRKLSGMISPFDNSRDFDVFLEVDGSRIQLTEIAESIRESALLRYRFIFDGEVFKVSGKARLDYLQPSNKEDQLILSSICRKDNGAALYDYLSKKAKRRMPPLFDRSNSSGWFLEFGYTCKLNELDQVQCIGNTIANPGPFHGEIDAVSLNRSDYRAHAMDKYSDFRKLVKDLAGIRVYRDGFGIRVGEDWLGLGKQWTSAPSYYGLKPSNIIGYVSLSAKENKSLVETTSREGFQVTPYYENLYLLLKNFIAFTGTAQDFIRRGTLQFLSVSKDMSVEVKPDEKPHDITRRIDDVATILYSKHKLLNSETGVLRNVASKATMTLKNVRKTINEKGLSNPEVSRSISKLDGALADVSAAVESTEALLNEVGTALSMASELKSLREVLDRRWENLHEELEGVYESVSLGLTAEMLSHEVHNIADGLSKRSSSILRRIQNGELKKAYVISYIEHVRSSAAGMRKQLSHMTPSLKYLRESKVKLNLVTLLEKIALYHNERLDKRGITVKIEVQNSPGGKLKVNQGKLTQIFDNMILNSDYWLREAIRIGKVESGIITLSIDEYIVTISDNGRGIDPIVENTLFHPFVTMKNRSQGRGLGLFVVQQLLDSEGCSIVLLPSRNLENRKFSFEINLAVCAI